MRDGRWIGILQPGYLPWEGFFEQWDRVDRFIVLDDVQFTRRDWRNRNRILGGSGAVWLTVPVKGDVAGRSIARSPIDRVEIDYGQDWARRHLRAIELSYRRAPHFDRYFDDLRAVYGRRYRLLVDLDEALRVQLGRWLGIATPVVRSSSMPIDAVKSERILTLCAKMGATDYYSGASARLYLDPRRFAAAGVRLWFQDYRPCPYPQTHGTDFVSHLSVLDLIFNVGPDSLDHIRSCASINAAT